MKIGTVTAAAALLDEINGQIADGISDPWMRAYEALRQALATEGPRTEVSPQKGRPRRSAFAYQNAQYLGGRCSVIIPKSRFSEGDRVTIKDLGYEGFELVIGPNEEKPIRSYGSASNVSGIVTLPKLLWKLRGSGTHTIRFTQTGIRTFLFRL